MSGPASGTPFTVADFGRSERRSQCAKVCHELLAARHRPLFRLWANVRVWSEARFLNVSLFRTRQSTSGREHAFVCC